MAKKGDREYDLGEASIQNAEPGLGLNSSPSVISGARGVESQDSSSSYNIKEKITEFLKAAPIASFVLIILVVFVAVVSPGVVMEVTQDIRGMKDKDFSDYMKFGLILFAGTFIFIFEIAKLALSKSMQTSQQENAPKIHCSSVLCKKWKVFPLFIMGVAAIVSFSYICHFAHGAERYLLIAYTILLCLQMVFFFRYCLSPKHVLYSKSKGVVLLYLQIALGIASNVTICIDIFIEELKEEPEGNSFWEFLHPFRFEFMLFCISLWLELLPTNKHVDNFDHCEGKDSQNENCCCGNSIRQKFYIFLAYIPFVAHMILNILACSFSCGGVKITQFDAYNYSNTTNTTSNNSDQNEHFFTIAGIISSVCIICIEMVILCSILWKHKTVSSEFRHSLKSNEGLLIVCALFFNMYQMAVLIPELSFLRNKSMDDPLYRQASVEFARSLLTVIYIIIQTYFILKLNRQKNKLDRCCILTHLYYIAIVMNIVAWFSNCIEKNVCATRKSREAYHHYWHVLQNTLLPAGIFFQWQSGELLIEIGNELIS